MKSAADDNKYELPGAVDFTGVPANCGPAQYPVRIQVEILLTIYEEGGMDRAVLVSDILKATSTHVAARELDVEAERREFEVWLLKEWPGADLRGAHPIGGFYYFDDDVNTAWGAWQAGAARFRAEGGSTKPDGAGQNTQKTAETRMDTGFLVLAESAQVSTEQAGDAWPDQAAFEVQARYQGATNFTLVHPDFMVCNNGWTPATYRDPMTELAWRVWANKRAPSPNNWPVGADKEPKCSGQ